jgi:tripartite-type tricarboxylate transporter receptor subunit TctC
MIIQRLLALAGLAGAVLAAAVPATAQEDPAKYPTKPIRMIVPFAPGGASDFAARLIQPGMSQFLGQQIVVENRPGAAGNVGMDVAARGAPDGYTVYLGNVGTVSINPYLFPDLTVKPEQDFIPVSLVAETPGVFVINPNFPANNVKELIAYVKKQPPGKVSFASPGSGSLNRLEMEIFRSEAGLDMTHVPYKGGAGPAVADVVAGHLPMTMVTVSSVFQHVKAGRLKAIGASTKERLPLLPDVPTMLELGFKNNVSSSWQGVLVPAKTPRPIVDKLHAAILHAMKDETVRKRMEEGSVYPVTSKSPEEFKTYLAAEAAKWSKVVKDTGAKPE